MKRWLRDASFRGLLKNSSYLAVARGVAGVLSLGALSFTAHSLDTNFFGLLILVHSYASAVSGLIKFQSWQIVIRYGAPALLADDTKQVQHGVGFAAGLDIASGVIGMLLAMAVLPFIAGWLHIDRQHLIYAILYCTLLPTMASATPSGILRLLDRFDLLAYQGTITPGVRLVLAGVGWIISADFLFFLIIWYITDLIGDLAQWWIALREMHKRTLLRGLKLGIRRHARELDGAWRFALMTNLTTSLQAGWGPLANLIVGGLLGTTAAGQYRIAAGIVEAANKPADMLSKAFYPEVMRLDTSTRKPWNLMLRGMVLSTAMGLVCVAIVLVGGKSFIATAFGSGFSPASGLLALMVFGLLVTMVSFPLSPMCYAVDRPGVPLRARMVATVTYLLIIVPLTHWGGLNGAGLAYVACMLLIGLLMIPPLFHEYRSRIQPKATRAV
jgi:O-antigen/teichoic acid export membrane protein